MNNFESDVPVAARIRIPAMRSGQSDTVYRVVRWDGGQWLDVEPVGRRTYNVVTQGSQGDRVWVGDCGKRWWFVTPV